MLNRHGTDSDSVFVAHRAPSLTCVSIYVYEDLHLRPLNVAVIGTGWCGGIRAETCAASPYVNELHVAETRPDRLAEIAQKTGAKTATVDYRTLLDIKSIDAVMISATPETLHYPMARECLLAGKHVFLEKPIA